MTGDIMNISRLRMGTDGRGVSTLVTLFGCPLRCAYCINDYCHESIDNHTNYETVRGAYSPGDLYARVLIDDIYFKMTGGGIVFGGGEPLLQSGFIHQFCRLADPLWTIRIETSLYSDRENMELILDDIDEWIVDIKDADPAVYRRYTGHDNSRVLRNLKVLLRRVPSEKIRVRVPHIPGFNTEADVRKTVSFLKETGITDIDEFEYIQTKPLPDRKNLPF
ncbi:MAG: radical SAM protein [Eubacteriales bacterium]|nr:radical SAM protein [Eubacteriales bacterium]